MRVIATAGHVDHGKSTLVEALTGIDPDRFAEEKRRGLTIDLGFAWLTLPSGLEVGIVDVPGHERFIRNMLAGVGSVDAVLFVVAADEGWMPQSAEHLQILEFLGVERGVVALTKTDAAGELADEAERDVLDHLDGTPFENAPIVRLSAKTGEGLDDLRKALDEVLASNDHSETRTNRTRLFVDRSFTITGAGSVVTGTLSSGRIAVGDEVQLLPGKRSARVRSLQTHGRPVGYAEAPRRLAMNLVGIDRRLVHRGQAVVTEEWLLTDRFAARVRAARDLKHPLKVKGAYELFAFSAQASCRLRLLGNTKELRAHESAFVIVSTARPLPLVPGDRFVIRDVGRWETVAGGAVIDPSPPRRLPGGYDAELEAREPLAGAALADWLLARDRFISSHRLLLLTGSRSAETPDGFVFAPGALEELTREAKQLVASFHRTQPLAPGLPIAELKRRIDPDVVDVVLDRSDELVVDGRFVRLATHGTSELSPPDRATADEALRTLTASGASPPDLADVGLSQQLARALERSGELVFLTPNIAYPSGVWNEIERRVVSFVVDNDHATLAQIRDAIGTTRKFAVPIAEKLDATGVTRRKGDLRELGPRGRELAER